MTGFVCCKIGASCAEKRLGIPFANADISGVVDHRSSIIEAKIIEAEIIEANRAVGHLLHRV